MADPKPNGAGTADGRLARTNGAAAEPGDGRTAGARPTDPAAGKPRVVDRAARPRPSRSELEFLPAALEIAETPPRPAGRAILWLICLLFTTAVAWACIGKVDIVATAQGRVVPSGRTKIIQPLEIGTVKEILVDDGARVHAGDVLVRLDDTEARADRDRLRKEVAEGTIEAARLQTAAAFPEGADAETVLAKFQPPQGADPAAVARHRALLVANVVEQAEKIAAIDKDAAQKQAERSQAETFAERDSETIPLLQKKATTEKTLAEKKLAKLSDALDDERSLIEAQEDLKVQQEKAREDEAALEASVVARRQTVEEYLGTVGSKLVDAVRRLAEARENLIKAEERLSDRTLTAPIDGTVQQLAIHTVGGVVTPAQELMEIVPDKGGVEIEARVDNTDIGFVHEGQRAEIKVETFLFTRYGLLHGHVVEVSRDATQFPQDSSGNASDSGAQRRSDPGKDGSPVYTARIKLDGDTLFVDGSEKQVTPGMAVTAEIKTGRRRIISFLLSPVLTYAHDSFREK